MRSWCNETMYQRSKKSFHYETQHTGEYPIIGSILLNSKVLLQLYLMKLLELKKKDYQINMLNNLHENKSKDAKASLQQIQNAATEVLMEAVSIVH